MMQVQVLSILTTKSGLVIVHSTQTEGLLLKVSWDNIPSLKYPGHQRFGVVILTSITEKSCWYYKPDGSSLTY